MGVLNCSRNGCNEILCCRYSYTYGYICKTCFEELCMKQPDSIEEFMDSRKPATPPVCDKIAEYDREFPIK